MKLDVVNAAQDLGISLYKNKDKSWIVHLDKLKKLAELILIKFIRISHLASLRTCLIDKDYFGVG